MATKPRWRCRTVAYLSEAWHELTRAGWTTQRVMTLYDLAVMVKPATVASNQVGISMRFIKEWTIEKDPGAFIQQNIRKTPPQTLKDA